MTSLRWCVHVVVVLLLSAALFSYRVESKGVKCKKTQKFCAYSKKCIPKSSPCKAPPKPGPKPSPKPSRPPPAAVPVPAPAPAPAGEPKTVFAVIGNWGSCAAGDYLASSVAKAGNATQGYIAQSSVVGQSVASFCTIYNCDFVITVGDNFYDLGIDAIQRQGDPQWDQCFNKVYKGFPQTTPFWGVLGNHDYGRSNWTDSTKKAQHSVFPQIEATYYDPRWMLPSRYYFANPGDVVPPKILATEPEHPQPGVDVFLSSFDSSPHIDDYCTAVPGASGYKYQSAELATFCQPAFRNQQLTDFTGNLYAGRTSGRTIWSIGFAHHPVISVNHGNYSGYTDPLLSIMSDGANSPDIFLSGHDHIFAHYKIPSVPATEFFTVGASGSADPGDAVFNADTAALNTSWGKNFGWDFVEGRLNGFAIFTLYDYTAEVTFFGANLTADLTATFEPIWNYTFTKTPPPPPSPNPPSPPPSPPPPPPPPHS